MLIYVLQCTLKKSVDCYHLLLFCRFNFIWFDSTTFLPYREEAAGESVMVKASGSLQLASITHVLAALTPNAKRIFLVLANYQIENAEAHYPGISFMVLYTRCRNEFLVTSDLELKAQVITEKTCINKRSRLERTNASLLVCSRTIR